MTGNDEKSVARPGAQTTDRRVRKTQTALAHALVGLLQETDWEQVSVATICERGDVARSTFYTHFDNKGALLDFAFASMTDTLRARFDLKNPGNVLVTVAWLIDHMEENRSIFAHSAVTGAGQGVLARFQAAMATLLQEELETRGTTVSRQDAVFAVAGCLAVLQHHAMGGDFPASLAQSLTAQVVRVTAGPPEPSA